MSSGEGRAASDELLFPAEAAALFRVDVKTINRWADAGRLRPIRTVGGHRRYEKDDVMRLREELREEVRR